MGNKPVTKQGVSQSCPITRQLEDEALREESTSAPSRPPLLRLSYLEDTALHNPIKPPPLQFSHLEDPVTDHATKSSGSIPNAAVIGRSLLQILMLTVIGKIHRA